MRVFGPGWEKVHYGDLTPLEFLHAVSNDQFWPVALRSDSVRAIKSLYYEDSVRLKKELGISNIKHILECKCCGKKFIDSLHIGRRKKYCSDKCRVAVWRSGKRYFKEKVCEFCGKTYSTQNSHVQKYCSLSCAAHAKGERKKKERPNYTCKKCGKEFWRYKRISDSHIFCSRKCAGINDKNKDGSSSCNWKHGPRRRAKHYGVGYETVDVFKVFERDMWTCQICGKKTPAKNRGTKRPNAPEIDHRIPLSRGGSHSYGNVQCACRRCNNKKSNKSSIGQLPLFDVA